MTQAGQIPIQYPQGQGNLAYLPSGYPNSNPYWQQPQQPQVDPIDQIAKVAKLLDYLQNKPGQQTPQTQAIPSGQEQVSQFAPSGVANVAQFQARGQANFDKQYQQEASPYAQGSTTSQQGISPNVSPNTNNNLEVRLANQVREQEQQIGMLSEVVGALSAECEAYQPIVAQLSLWMELAAEKDAQINALSEACKSLIFLTEIGEIHAQDIAAYLPALTTLSTLYDDAGHLIAKGFDSLKNTQLSEYDLGMIADMYLAATEKYVPIPQPTKQQQLYQQTYQQPQAYQPQIPLPIPGESASNQPQGIYAVLDMMRNPQGPDTARTLQRMRMAGAI